MSEVEERLAVLEEQVERNGKDLARLMEMVDAIRLDLHAAKVGGRLLVGVTLLLGGVVGWAVSVFFSRGG